MLSNAYFLAKFRFDTAENEPAKNLQNFANFPNFANPNPNPGRLAEQILQDMIADGHKPTSITLSILVKLYGRTSLEQALQVFADLPAQYDFTPNAQVFTCLMSVALTHRDVPEALRIKDRMQATGARPDQS